MDGEIRGYINSVSVWGFVFEHGISYFVLVKLYVQVCINEAEEGR